VNARSGAIHRRTLLVSSLALGMLWPRGARAYRPFDSTDAAVAARGEMEIELGPLGFAKEGPERSLVAPSAIVNWGFAERCELVLEGRHFVQLGERTNQPRSRVEDTALSLKGVLREGSLQEKSGPSVATEVGTLLPTINGEPGVGGQGALIVSQRWSDLTVHVNGVVAWTRAHRLGLFGGVIFEAHDAWAVRPVAELFAEGERDVPTVFSGLAGVIWRVREGLSLDAGLRLARAGGVKTTEIRAGLTCSFGAGFPR
jgi:hypothetical protein